jgi:hypothetical protein
MKEHVRMQSMKQMIPFLIVALAAGGISSTAADHGDKPAGLLFRESFDDAQLLKREWYDGEKFAIDTKNAKAGDGSLSCHFAAKGTIPDDSRGARRLFEPSETIYLKFYLRLSKDFGWTGRNYHPHLIQFMTTENGRWHGPAASHLTVYVEPVNGKLRLAAQDIQNKDQPHGLTQGELKGGYNGQLYDSEEVLFKDGQWHLVEALFQLNSLDVKGDNPNKDGIVRGWFDGKKVIDRTDVVLRSTDFPKMKFNQILVLPYFGPGLLPHEQTLWIDELAVGTKRLERDKAEKP